MTHDPQVVIAGVGQLLGVDLTARPLVKSRRMVTARRAAVLILRELGMSYPEIAQAMGYRSHASAIAAEVYAEREEGRFYSRRVQRPLGLPIIGVRG